MSRYRNFGLFMALAAVWGSAFMAIKAGLAYFPPVLFAAIRYDIAGVLMLAYAWWAVDRWRPRNRGEWWVVCVGAVFMIAGYHAFLFVGQQWTTSAAAAVIVSLNPVLTTGFARGLLPGERLSPLGIAGLLLGLAGTVVIAQPDPGNLLGGDAVGELLVLAAIASFALGSVLARRSSAGLPIETMEAWSMVGGAIVMHAVSPVIGESAATIRWAPAGIAALGFLALAASAGGFLIYFDLLDRLGPIEINLVSYVAPLWAALSGWVVLGETVDAATVAGFLVIVAGFALIKRGALAEEWGRLRRALRLG